MTVATVPQQTAAQTGPGAKRITGEDLLAMGDIGPCELIDGRIVRKAPAQVEHAIIETTLGSCLVRFVTSRKIGQVTGGGVGVYTRRNPDTVRAVDIACVSKDRQAGHPGAGFLEAAPDLIVEIMSPADRWQDVRQKLEEYFAIGVYRVWIMEPHNRDVLVYRSVTEMGKLGEGEILGGEGILEGFSLPIAELFEE